MYLKSREIKFRENWSRGVVTVMVNGLAVYADQEYRGAAEWTQRQYGLDDSDLMKLYADYKEDFDAD
jgi:hypothetical protein